ncbi:MAG: hypothetical protein Q8N99_03050 [Nanoarchaeota archaeon]|nr:hypothetical protein [Nanoarchaeota archaeon]
MVKKIKSNNKNLKRNRNIILFIIVLFVIIAIFFFISYISLNKISGKAIVESCSDSDNGLNYNLGGSVDDNNGNYGDYCSNGKLMEAYCEDTKVSWREYSCSGECSDGECVEKSIESIQTESCSDSDNGLNYNLRGTIKYCDFNNICVNMEDNCEKGKLNEYYCENDKIAVERFYSCKFGCLNGACMGTADSGGGGGSSGGSSGGSVPEISQTINYQTYSLGELIVSEVEAGNNDKIKLSILKNSSNTEYTLSLSELSLTSIMISVENPAQSISFSIGEEKYIDLDSDTLNEILIKLKSISITTNKAKLLITRV